MAYNPMTPMSPARGMGHEDQSMKIAKYREETIPLLQQGVNFFEQLMHWEDEMFLMAHDIGLQGRKRENRFEGTKDYNIRKYLQSATRDIFTVTLHPQTIHEELPMVNNFESYFKAYRAKLWECYYMLHEMANKLVAPLCLKKLSCPLYERADCIMDDIIELNRLIDRGTMSNWNVHDVLIYETHWENIHDKYEEKENKQGYSY